MHSLTPGELRAALVWRLIKQFGPTTVQVAGTIWLSVLLARNTHSGLWWLPGLVVLAGTIWGLVWASASRRAEQLVEQLRTELATLAGPRNERVQFLLRGLLQDLGINTVDVRASIFAPCLSGQFVQIGRYSDNATFATTIRMHHEKDQGIVAETWAGRQSLKTDLPKDRDLWNRRIVDDYRLPLEVVERLRMQSRSYLCRRIDRVEGGLMVPVGVLVIESLAPKGVSANFHDIVANAYQLELMSTECSSAIRLDGLNGDVKTPRKSDNHNRRMLEDSSE
ncbi:hypothetical protein [Paeniglutamicibacter psychrophenolicus]|uniref:hypothetical protein n=1 Tax=Paeniglutamicibacter psychrophenolicus TaxID=257454 RepID=UPI002785011E|nr:hypothetical protein [Paeniglutamicibacter psychrophenolicus]MDQ0092577.1 hypothetical protein [Paeniglutamicibacter psychrophenolicus]